MSVPLREHLAALREADLRFNAALREADQRALSIKETADLAALELAREYQTYKDMRDNRIREQLVEGRVQARRRLHFGPAGRIKGLELRHRHSPRAGRLCRCLASEELNMTDPSTASRDLSLLAPRFRERVEAAIADAEAQGYPVGIAEAGRTNEHQVWLYAQGRTRPGNIVTNAPTALTSWHGYFLAIDFMHRTLGFKPHGNDDHANEAWFAAVAAIFKKHGLAWGGDWRKPDTPHVQWGSLPTSPQRVHKDLKSTKGNAAVWRLVGAADADFHNSEAPNAPVALLRLGARGGMVHELQEKLGITADGIFGPATEAAVKALQSRKGLVVDGSVGPKTWAVL